MTTAATPEKLRNIGIISHIDAGKTTVSERILFYTGEIHKMGEVHDGMASMDWMEQEQERGITITATTTRCQWNDYTFNLIDTPGHIDFTIEVERSLRALDGAVAIFSAVDGVQPQSESVWRQADRYRVPRLCLINKMDRIGSDYTTTLKDMQEKLHARPILLQLPVGAEDSFSGVIDLLEKRLLRFSEDDQGRSLQIEAVPDDLQEQMTAARERIIEAAADFDDSILSDFLDGLEIEGSRIIAALRKGTIACQIFPVLLGSALRNKGIQPLLDAICTLLPSPFDVPQADVVHPETGTLLKISSEAKGPFCALAFKVLADEGRKLTYMRIYSGSLAPGDTVWNSTGKQSEKVARLFRMHAHKRERIKLATAGDIVTATGLKHVLTGDTLCHESEPLLLAGLEYPAPVVSLAVEPKTVDDRDKLMPTLEKLQWEDPTFLVKEDKETGQTLLTGMGELHLEVIIKRLSCDFGVNVITGRPQVVYRETVKKSVEHLEQFDKEIDGKTHQAEISLRLSPMPRKSGLELVLPPEVMEPLPDELRLQVKEKLEQACQSGAVAGYPLTDLKIEILAIPFEPGRTSELGLSAATTKSISDAVRKAAPTLLEPIMLLELTAPPDYTGRVMGTLQQKRGQIEGVESRPGQDVIRGTIPLFEMFGYMTELRSVTKGQGSFTMEFSHFDQAPAETLQLFGL
ncbi:MAG TPA: elongation factor G [Geopsychrobacteraceae bacterium]|nr:elongation factor G [Geopsychrobacteraceae bacterium]